MRQNGPFQFFYTNSSANLHWPEWKRALGPRNDTPHNRVAQAQRDCPGVIAKLWQLRNDLLQDALHQSFQDTYWLDRKEFQWIMYGPHEFNTGHAG